MLLKSSLQSSWVRYKPRLCHSSLEILSDVRGIISGQDVEVDGYFSYQSSGRFTQGHSLTRLQSSPVLFWMCARGLCLVSSFWGLETLNPDQWRHHIISVPPPWCINWPKIQSCCGLHQRIVGTLGANLDKLGPWGTLFHLYRGTLLSDLWVLDHTSSREPFPSRYLSLVRQTDLRTIWACVFFHRCV